ncbi:MAG: helix-turn-helix transcriptional regulator [Oscillospiraceae bacterium]|nr:helix-turn-helix transcriptional regulator [Oscillospiraceae bacterium]
MYIQFHEDYRQLGLNILFYRKRKNLTQEKLAEAIKKETHHISNIELAKSAPSLDVVFGIARVLEVPTNKLFEFRE